MKKLLVLLLLLQLGGCVFLATNLGLAPTAVQTAQVIDSTKLAVDLVSSATTEKTLTDHILSLASGQDCKTIRVIKGEEVCQRLCS